MKNFSLVLLSCLFFPVLTLRAEMTPHQGPGTGKLGDVAQIALPDGYTYYEKKDMKEFMEKSHNFYSDDQLGVLVNPSQESGYMALFSFDEMGYIKDAASEKLDADAMWKEMLDNEKAANEERKSKGWTEIFMVDWEEKPNYNAERQRLEWATKLKDNTGEFVNFNTRVLGRKGVMRITLVPNADLRTALSSFNDAIAGFEYTSGNRYAEWTSGDKVAEIGLAALVVGGAGALAVKSGLLAKFWKLILVGFAAMAGFIKKLWNKLTGNDSGSGSGGITS